MQAIISKIRNYFNPAGSLKALSPSPATVQVQIPTPKPATPAQNPTICVSKKVKLIMVTENNNNKFYDMIDNNNGTFTVKYGRVGSRETELTYPISEWDLKYNEKIRKGYVDNTHLFAAYTPESDTSTIQNKNVRGLMEGFFKYAKQSIKNNYIVTASDVIA
jgi:poly [ADP-ribose] polymerase 2/3/4